MEQLALAMSTWFHMDFAGEVIAAKVSGWLLCMRSHCAMIESGVAAIRTVFGVTGVGTVGATLCRATGGVASAGWGAATLCRDVARVTGWRGIFVAITMS